MNTQLVEPSEVNGAHAQPRRIRRRATWHEGLRGIPVRQPSEGAERTLGLVLHDLKACLWSGSRQPLSIRLAGAIPDKLREFAGEAGDWLQRVYPPDRRVVERWAKLRRDAEALRPIEYRLVTDSADIVWVRQWLRPEDCPISNVCAWGIVQVIDAKKRLESECLRVCERERTAIGQELHDDVCQLLAGMACVLEVVTRRVTERAPDMQPLLSELALQLQRGMERTRSLAHGLVPARLVNLGLARALQELAGQARVLYGVTIRLQVTKGLPAHSATQILQLYRIAQESISNAVKHGKATTIQLTLRQNRDELMLSIQDNGTGLPPEGTRPNGIGLHVMAYRASAISASLRLGRPAGGGTRVTVTYGCNKPRSQTLET